MERKIKLYLGIPSTGTRSDFQGYVLRSIEKTYSDRIEFVYPDKCVHRIFHDFARCAVVDDFLATDCDILWFLDSDIAPDPKCLDIITEHGNKWKAAGCPYPVFMTPAGEDHQQIVFTVYKGLSAKGGMAPAKVPYEGLEFVDGIATGCLFVKREVFEQMKKPYFEFKYDPENRHMTEGEDIGFCKKLSDMGIQFFIDYSKPCKHYKNVELLDVNNYAISYAQKAVEAYHEQIKGKIEKLVAIIKDKNDALTGGIVAPQGQECPGEMDPLSLPRTSKLILPKGYGSQSPW